MKYILSLCLLLLVTTAHSQTFTNSTGGSIPDNNTEVFFPVTVSGLPSAINSSFGITSCCFDIIHPYTSDLGIRLRSPDGNTITLSERNGMIGSSDYLGTCLQMDGIDGYIMLAWEPFTGNFIPEQSLNLLNNGQNPNGVWYLGVRDYYPADAGMVFDFSITFGANPPPDPPSIYECSYCKCPDTTMSDCDLLPDMTASALIIQQEHTEFPGLITLSNATPNIGWGPFEVRGTDTCYCGTTIVPCPKSPTDTCPDGSYHKRLINQRIYHKSGIQISYYDIPAGTISTDPSHKHTHVDNWAHYSLRTKGPYADPATWPIVGVGSKVSFCLINLSDCTSSYGYCVDTMGNVLAMSDIRNSPLGWFTGCNMNQGIFTGMLDIYDEFLPGQEIILPLICNGDYYIVSVTDPDNLFRETNENNNAVAVPVTLTQQIPNCCKSDFKADYISTNPPTIQFIDLTTPMANNWYWDFGDGTTSTQQHPLHIYPDTGSYNVSLVTSTNTGCTDTLVKNNFIIAGIEKDNELSALQLKVYPNPYNGKTTIQYHLQKAFRVQADVFTLMGTKITTLEDKNCPAGDYKYNFSARAEGYAAGVYILRLRIGENIYHYKLIEF